MPHFLLVLAHKNKSYTTQKYKRRGKKRIALLVQGKAPRGLINDPRKKGSKAIEDPCTTAGQRKCLVVAHFPQQPSYAIWSTHEPYREDVELCQIPKL